MDFKKYQHIERFGNDEVDGIEVGDTYVFPKLDGTNASIWYNPETDNEAGYFSGGSRSRQLTLEKDNAGFLNWLIQPEQNNIHQFLRDNPKLRLYGEWLVPHSLKTYRESAWRKFYVFDVMDHSSNPDGEYMHYLEYRPLLDEYDIEYIPYLATVHNGSYEDFLRLQKTHNDYLIEDGCGKGEGVVIKNYKFVNLFGRQTWAKIVTSEFKEVHRKTMGGHEINGSKMVEQEIAEKYVTQALCEKTLAKIKTEGGGWSSKQIPQLLGQVYYDLVREDAWNFVKEHKNPKINFKTLNTFTIQKIKEHLPEVF